MCMMNKPVWRKQAEIKWSRRGIFIFAWCNCGKLCALAARPLQSQQSGALTRMCRWCQVQPSQKERAIGADVVGTFQLALHLKCDFHMLSTRKWPDMNMCLYLNLAKFQYIDGFGCYHFCLNRIGWELIIFFWTFSKVSLQFCDCRLLQLSVQFWDCRLLWTVG